MVGWALDGHVPGLNEAVAPDPAPVPVAKQVDNALEQVRQASEEVQTQTEQLVENIQKNQ